MKVAAYQAPLLPAGSTDRALRLIRERVEWCESEDIEILCCPEGVLGGLADYATPPIDFAIDVGGGQLELVLAPIASDRVTTIVGFTERGPEGRLYNAAAVFHCGSVLGVYRKLHPAIRTSVYSPGNATPVFVVGGLTFGIVICLDSTFTEPARLMAEQGAAALFVPANNGMPSAKGGSSLVVAARDGDISRAVENGVSVIRADVAGHAGDLASFGSSGIVDRHGVVLAAARTLEADLIVADIETTPRRRRASRFSVAPLASTDIADADVEALLRRVYVGGGFTEPAVGDGMLAAEKVRERGQILAAVDSAGQLLGVVVAVLAGSPACRFASDGESELHLLAVHPDNQRNGVGSALVAEAISVAKMAGATRMFLWTQPEMETAQRLYVKHGFERVPELDFSRGARRFLVFALSLTPRS